MVVLESLENTYVEAYNLNLVTFRNVSSYYTLDKDIVVEFEMDPQLKGSSWDWIAIFKEGWNTYESYLIFEWGIGRPCEGRRRKIKFGCKYLNKHVSLNTNYQFVYISKHLEIFGESRYFQFKLPFIQTVSRICDIPSLCEQEKFQELYHGDVNSCLLKKYPLIKNVFTSCAHCKNVLQCSTSEEKLNKLQEYEAKYIELGKKVENLECVVETLVSRLKIDDVYNAAFAEVCRYKDTFSPKSRMRNVKRITADKDVCDKETTVVTPIEMTTTGVDEVAAVSSPDYRSQLALVETEASLVLKAIIGRQEQKIRELTQLINKKSNFEEISEDVEKGWNVEKKQDHDLQQEQLQELQQQQHKLQQQQVYGLHQEQMHPSGLVCSHSTEPIEQHVVRIIKTQEKMLAQILNLNNNCVEYTNEAELKEKGSKSEKTPAAYAI